MELDRSRTAAAAPAGGLYSTDEVADHLGLHVRTVRRYVREGRLPAVKIGKQYRIAAQDLEALTGCPAPVPATDAPGAEPTRAKLHVDVSTIVTAEPLEPEAAARVTRNLLAAVRGREAETQSFRIEAVYDKERERLKLITTGSLASTSVVLGLTGALLVD